MRDTRPDYPPEFDLPDDSEWEGARLNDISIALSMEGLPPADVLRAVDKYGDSGATVSVALPNGERFIVPDDLGKIRKLSPEEPVAAFIVHGIAWDGSDWEFNEDVPDAEGVQAGLDRFREALDEHLWNSED